MVIAMQKLNNTKSFRAWGLTVPLGAIVRGHTVPIFRRLRS
jgi:hypothetical protein